MYFIFLCSLLFVAATTDFAVADWPDIVSSGNYQIHLCDSGEPSSNASYLQQLLPQIYTNLQAVIADARLGTASEHGYGTFFKTNDNIEEVVKVYQDIAAGNDLFAQAVPGSAFPGLVNANPTFVCIRDTTETASIYQLCNQHGLAGPMVFWVYSNIIAICPLFWEEKIQPVARIDCPQVGGQASSPDNQDLLFNQQAMVVQGLADVYESWTASDTITNAQAAVSLRYAKNYAYYYSAVQAGCNRWPKQSPSTTNQADTSIPGSNNETLPATSGANPSRLAIRQDSCISWLEAPNSTVCCDHSSGQWVETGVQRDDSGPGGPACSDSTSEISPDGSVVEASSVAETIAAATSAPASYIQQDYCSEAMELPNATVCCDMSSGLWVPAPVIRDSAATESVSAACPNSGDGSGGSTGVIDY